MKIAPVADVKARLSADLEMGAKRPVVVTKNGRPTAVLIAVSDEEELDRLVIGHTPRFRAILEAVERRIWKGRGISRDDFWMTMGKEPRRPRTGRPATSSWMARASRRTPDA